MKISDKLLVDVEVDNQELKFLLSASLVQLSAYDDRMDIVGEETFNIEQVLRKLELDLNIHQEVIVEDE